MPTKASYEGEKDRNGEPHGYGVANFPGGQYSGEWSCGAFHGFGELQLQSGTHYVGEFLDKKMHGKGRLRFSDGRLYEGEMRSGKMHGRGALQNPNGIYKGTFLNGHRHGQGTIWYIDDSIYAGEWREDKICGNGKLIQGDGVVYEGKWEGGVMSGIVHMTKMSGSVYRQQYFDGRLVKSERVKSGPGAVTKMLFSAEAKKFEEEQRKLRTVPPKPTIIPPEATRPSGFLAPPPEFTRPMSAPTRPKSHVDPEKDLHATSFSPDQSLEEALPAPHQGTGSPGRGTSSNASPSPRRGDSTAHDSDEEVENGVKRLRKIKSLKDMSLKPTSESASPEVGGIGEGSPLNGSMTAGSPLARKNSMKRPVSAQAVLSGSFSGPASPSLNRSPSFARSQAPLDSPRLAAKTSEELDRLAASISLVGGDKSPGESALIPTHDVTDDEAARVRELARHASTLQPLPPPLEAPNSFARSSSGNGHSPMQNSVDDDDAGVTSLSREKRSQSRLDMKAELALHKSLTGSFAGSAAVQQGLRSVVGGNEKSPNRSFNGGLSGSFIRSPPTERQDGQLGATDSFVFDMQLPPAIQKKLEESPDVGSQPPPAVASDIGSPLGSGDGSLRRNRSFFGSQDSAQGSPNVQSPMASPGKSSNASPVLRRRGGSIGPSAAPPGLPPGPNNSFSTAAVLADTHSLHSPVHSGGDFQQSTGGVSDVVPPTALVMSRHSSQLISPRGGSVKSPNSGSDNERMDSTPNATTPKGGLSNESFGRKKSVRFVADLERPTGD